MKTTVERLVELVGKGFALPLLALVLLAGMKGGPDYIEYLEWARAFASGNINDIQSICGTPTNLPLIRVGHGAGMFFAVAEIARSRLGAIDFRVIGWIAAIVMWNRLLQITSRLAEDRRLGMFVCGALFLGTPLGFYSVYAASETLSNTLVACLAWWVVMKSEWQRRDWIAVGCVSGLLAAVRPILLVYSLAAMAIEACRVVEKRGIRSLEGLARKMAMAIVPLAIGIGQVMLVNKWMTGTLWRSPYYFGGVCFKSIDLGRPFLAAVLFHPLHGAVIYHPLFAVALAAAILLVIRTNGCSLGRIGIGIGLLAIFVHLWGQASWYCWWMGEGTFGSRALGAAAVPAGAVLASALRTGKTRRVVTYALAAAIIAVSAWSGLLLGQGHTNFVTFGELWSGLLAYVSRLQVVAAALLAIVAGIAAAGLAAGKESRMELLSFFCAGATMFVCGVFVASNGFDSLSAFILQVGDLGWHSLVFNGFCGGLGSMWAICCDAKGLSYRVRDRFSANAAVAVFLCCLCLFGRLAVRAERICRGYEPQTRCFECLCSTDLGEAKETLEEYEKIPGFDQHKDSLRNFLDEEEKRCYLR